MFGNDQSCSINSSLNELNKSILLNSILSAMEFIVRKQSPDGFWSDFNTSSSGESTEWVTGYVGFNIIESIQHLHQAGFDYLNILTLLEKSKKALSNSQRLNGGWGYNQNVPEDADSTSHCLLFLLMLDGNLNDYEKSVKVLLKHQEYNSGGFLTYNSLKIKTYLENKRPNIKNVSFKEWQSPHCCVTPIAARLLFHLNNPNTTDNFEKAYNFIKNMQNKEGYWPSYWWNNIYATYHCLYLMQIFNKNEDNNHVIAALAWLVNSLIENNDINGINYKKTPFYTALALKSLLISPSKVTDEMIVGISNWLLREQLEDGSWPSYPILKIPKPYVDDIKIMDDEQYKYRMHEDQHRIFTTSICLSAISELFAYIQCGE